MSTDLRGEGIMDSTEKKLERSWNRYTGFPIPIRTPISYPSRDIGKYTDWDLVSEGGSGALAVASSRTGLIWYSSRNSYSEQVFNVLDEFGVLARWGGGYDNEEGQIDHIKISTSGNLLVKCFWVSIGFDMSVVSVSLWTNHGEFIRDVLSGTNKPGGDDNYADLYINESRQPQFTILRSGRVASMTSASLSLYNQDLSLLWEHPFSDVSFDEDAENQIVVYGGDGWVRVIAEDGHILHEWQATDGAAKSPHVLCGGNKLVAVKGSRAWDSDYPYRIYNTSGDHHFDGPQGADVSFLNDGTLLWETIKRGDEDPYRYERTTQDGESLATLISAERLEPHGWLSYIDGIIVTERVFLGIGKSRLTDFFGTEVQTAHLLRGGYLEKTEDEDHFFVNSYPLMSRHTKNGNVVEIFGNPKEIFTELKVDLGGLNTIELADDLSVLIATGGDHKAGCAFSPYSSRLWKTESELSKFEIRKNTPQPDPKKAAAAIARTIKKYAGGIGGSDGPESGTAIYLSIRSSWATEVLLELDRKVLPHIRGIQCTNASIYEEITGVMPELELDLLQLSFLPGTELVNTLYGVQAQRVLLYSCADLKRLEGRNCAVTTVEVIDCPNLEQVYVTGPVGEAEVIRHPT
jgi:hypothetical protein